MRLLAKFKAIKLNKEKNHLLIIGRKQSGKTIIFKLLAKKLFEENQICSQKINCLKWIGNIDYTVFINVVL